MPPLTTEHAGPEPGAGAAEAPRLRVSGSVSLFRRPPAGGPADRHRAWGRDPLAGGQYSAQYGPILPRPAWALGDIWEVGCVTQVSYARPCSLDPVLQTLFSRPWSLDPVL
jgi:hypothetical protein